MSESRATEGTNAILDAIADVAKSVRHLGRRLDDHDDELRELRRTIHGSKPPMNGNGASHEPLAVQAARGSAAGFDVEELRGELLAVRTELERQSGAMGLGKKGLRWLTSAEGRNTVVRLLTLAGAGYAAFRAALM